ncbi:MAG TPA: MBL fold metallo-hydrolase [Azospirillum sp.]|nr:MBL fold metallo-hydrolase [Azospirillum sp.]
MPGMRIGKAFAALGVVLGTLLLTGLWPIAAAQADCLPIAHGPARVLPVALRLAQAPGAGQVRLTFLGHSSFVIESAGGVSAVTDYNDYIRPPFRPDVATMNVAHDTHFTDHPDPEIAHVLRGWDPGGGMAQHDVTVKDMRVRNVPTNIRGYGGGYGGGGYGTRVAGNSIFVFEVGGLCIAHLGHLHHTLTDVHLKELGIIDVVLAAVDGSFTISHADMVQVIEQLRPAVVIPMHYFGGASLERFIATLAGRYEPKLSDTPTVVLSRARLPQRQLLILPGH